MNDCYNVGWRYLKSKYGYKRDGFTCAFDTRLRKARTRQEHRAMMAEATDQDYITTLNRLPDNAPLEDRTIELLLHQINNSVSMVPKKELYNILAAMNLL